MAKRRKKKKVTQAARRAVVRKSAENRAAKKTRDESWTGRLAAAAKSVTRPEYKVRVGKPKAKTRVTVGAPTQDIGKVGGLSVPVKAAKRKRVMVASAARRRKKAKKRT